MKECATCGAAVFDQERHTQWHQSLDTILISYVKTRVDPSKLKEFER